MIEHSKNLKSILDKYEVYRKARFQPTSELYKMPDGSLISAIEYRKIMDKLDLEYKKEIRKQDRGMLYVGKDGCRVD